MKKQFISLFILYSFISYPQSKKPDFQNAYWGMTKKEVIKSSIRKLKDIGEDYISVEDHVGFYNAEIHYNFVNDTLNGGMIIFKINHTNNNDFIDDFDNIKSLLSIKYGKPDYCHVDWKNDMYKGDKQYYGLAVSMGDLTYGANWFFVPGTWVGESLTGDNYKIELSIIYQSTKYKYLNDRVNKNLSKDF